jgi:nucleoside-diphosphate-sugar epimerase
MKYLITGGAGFIGSFMVAKLIASNDEVVVVDNLFRGSIDNIKHLLTNSRFSFFNIDIINENEKFTELIGSELPDTIIHYAAINGTKYFYDIPFEVAYTNGIITEKLCLSIQKNLKSNYKPRIIFSSTSEVYGEPFNIPTNEEDLTYLRISENRDSYAAGKLYSEFLLKLFAEKYKLEWIIFRIFNVYGPNMINSSYGQVVPELVSRTVAGEYPLKLIGDGLQKRSFIYIDDHINLTLLALKFAKWNDVYNLGNPEEISIVELASNIMNLCNLKPSFEFIENRSGDHLRRCPDLSKLFKYVKNYSFIGLNEGLKLVIDKLK